MACSRIHNAEAQFQLRRADPALAVVGSILRLADILDFDASRTPAILFRHLGLDGKAGPFEKKAVELSPKRMAAAPRHQRRALPQK